MFQYDEDDPKNRRFIFMSEKEEERERKEKIEKLKEEKRQMEE